MSSILVAASTRRGRLAGAALLALPAVLALSVAPSLAAWSSDPSANLAVADASGDQVQPKIAPTADGGAWIGWFDAIANGFDVRVQKLDSAGDEVFAHAGILVADRGFSSTQDYGMDADSAGDALLAFRDDRGTGVQITAAKVTAAGVQPWGAGGVQLTSTTAFVAAPKIAGTSDGGAVVAWTEDASVKLRKLDGAGSLQWAADVVLTPAAGSYAVSDLHDAGTDVILAFVHQTGSFGSPRHLYAQKFDATGAALWGAGAVAVFDGGSLQFGNFPTFVPDGSGGGVFSWYDAASLALQCSAQRILSGGGEAFPHNGTVVSTNAARVRVAPAACFDAATSETYVFWEEKTSDQSQTGIYGQKLDASGVRQWTDDGKVLVPVGTEDPGMVRTLAGGPGDAGAFAFWRTTPGLGEDLLVGAHLDPTGAFDLSPFFLATSNSSKSRLAAAASTAGFSILAWTDDRADAGDVYAQNVNADGSLGGGGTPAPIAGPAASSLRLAARPNPSPGAVRIDWTVPAGADAELAIYDVRGRAVRTGLLAASRSARRGVVVWDGRDDRGEAVAAGVYFARLASGPEQRSLRLVRID
jgi:hypothetical protein